MSASAVAHSSPTWPCDSTTNREASARISSRSSLTSSTPAPASRAARSRAWISALAWKSSPKQGLATISSRGLPSSSRASTARCTLPPDSVSIAASGPGVLILKAAILATACARIARRDSHGPRASGARSKPRSARLKSNPSLPTQALCSGSSGRLRTLESRIIRRVGR